MGDLVQREHPQNWGWIGVVMACGFRLHLFYTELYGMCHARLLTHFVAAGRSVRCGMWCADLQIARPRVLDPHATKVEKWSNPSNDRRLPHSHYTISGTGQMLYILAYDYDRRNISSLTTSGKAAVGVATSQGRTPKNLQSGRLYIGRIARSSLR